MTGRSVLALLALAAVAGCGPGMRTAGWVVRDRLEPPGGPEAVCAATGTLDRVLVQVRGRGDAYYRSELAPAAEALGDAGRDPLGELLAACGDRDLAAWLNVYFLWQGDAPPAAPEHAANAHPEWLLRDADGRSVAEYGAWERATGWIEGLYADPDSAGYRDHFAALVRELVTRYPVREVHLDFVRYPGPGYGQGGALGERFAAAWGVDPRLLPAGLRVPEVAPWLAGELPPAESVLTTAALLWAEARAGRVTALVRAVRAALDEATPGVRLSAAVFPDPADAYLAKGQDWPGWAAAGLVDALYPMAYFGGAERVARQLEAVAAATPAGVELWAGLGAFLKEPGTLAREADAARSLGCDGVCLFDVGAALDAPAGLDGYLAAVTGPRGVRAAPPPPPVLDTAVRGGAWLGAVAARAAGGILPPGAGPALDARWAEFAAARPALDAARAALEGPARVLPAALDLAGVFRYVHPGDGPARRAEQREKADAARERLLAGEDPAAVAAELSQGGTRELGGSLPRRYLWPGAPLTGALRALEEGAVSPVVQVANGFWVYKVLRREAPRPVAPAKSPWDARRLWFRRALGEALEAGVPTAKATASF